MSAHAPGGNARTPMWIVQYSPPDYDDWSPWCRVQTREEAVWQAYRREQAGWAVRIIDPTTLETLRQLAKAVG